LLCERSSCCLKLKVEPLEIRWKNGRKQITLKHPPLFESFDEIKDDDIRIDLHNYYYCYEVEHDETAKTIRMQFVRSNVTLRFENIIIILIDIEIAKISTSLFNFHQGRITLDTFYRGRFEVDGALYEYSHTGKDYYYIDFFEERPFDGNICGCR
jgi:hypothetical protein